MSAIQKQDTYTMPLEQLLELLETTADDATRVSRRPRVRLDLSRDAKRRDARKYERSSL